MPAGHKILPPQSALPLPPVGSPILKVLEMGQLIAGPFAAKTLADFGADVIKIEPPGAGDPLRFLGHQRAEKICLPYHGNSRQRKPPFCGPNPAEKAT